MANIGWSLAQGGYPLIHNSEFLRDYGYYYPDFAAEAGGAALIAAVATHDASLDAYRASVARLVGRLDPASPANIALHERLLTGD